MANLQCIVDTAVVEEGTKKWFVSYFHSWFVGNIYFFTPSLTLKLLVVENIVEVKKSLLPGLFWTIKDVPNLPQRRDGFDKTISMLCFFLYLSSNCQPLMLSRKILPT